MNLVIQIDETNTLLITKHIPMPPPTPSIRPIYFRSWYLSSPYLPVSKAGTVKMTHGFLSRHGFLLVGIMLSCCSEDLRFFLADLVRSSVWMGFLTIASATMRE